MLTQFLDDNGIRVTPTLYSVTPSLMQRLATEFDLGELHEHDTITLTTADGAELVIEPGTVN